jgi:flagellar protein FlbD
MILLTRLNGQVININDDLIEVIETTPDTLLCMATGKKYIVKESVEEVLAGIIDFRRRCFSNPTFRFQRSKGHE